MKLIILNLIGNLTIQQFAIYYAWGFFGLLLSALVERVRHKNAITKSGGFNIIYWLQDNWDERLLSLMAIAIGIIFGDQILHVPLNEYGAFTAGFLTDKTIEALMALRTNNNKTN